MKQLVLAGFNWTYLTNAALIIFMVLFVSILFWIFRKESNEVYSEAANMPLLEEGESHESK